jgi:hypothetical protein
MGCEALLHLGFQKNLARDLRKAFIKTEEETGESLYQHWLESEDKSIHPGFRDLFMQQEAALRNAMQDERSENNQAGEEHSNPTNGT